MFKEKTQRSLKIGKQSIPKLRDRQVLENMKSLKALDNGRPNWPGCINANPYLPKQLFQQYVVGQFLEE